MKKFNVLTALLFICFAFAAMSAHAQSSDAPDKAISIGVGVEGLLPLGNFGDSANPGGGVDLKFKYNLPNISGAATATVGVNVFAPKSDGADVTYIGVPVKLGYQAIFAESFTIEPQVGLYRLSASADGETDSTTGFLIGAELGYNLTQRSNFGLGYSHMSKDGGSLGFVGVHYYYSF